jgi:abnormal spindle-like microcephaly-associated protein
VENFTVSFSDGRALCYILHHYHPNLLSLEAVNDQTTLTCHMESTSPSTLNSDGEEDSFMENWTHTVSPSEYKLNPLTLTDVDEFYRSES